MNRPAIKTAIPKHRYQIGAFTVIVLDEIETSDPTPYQFVAAVMRDGDPEPGIYLTVERPADAVEGKTALPLKLIMRDGTQLVKSSERWWDVETFTQDMLDYVRTILDMPDEEPYRLL